MKDISNKRYQEIINDCFCVNLGAIWDYALEIADGESYENKKDIFCILLSRAMKEGILKLANNGSFLDGSIEDQVNFFKKSFPENEKNKLKTFLKYTVVCNIASFLSISAIVSVTIIIGYFISGEISLTKKMIVERSYIAMFAGCILGISAFFMQKK